MRKGVEKGLGRVLRLEAIARDYGKRDSSIRFRVASVRFRFAVSPSSSPTSLSLPSPRAFRLDDQSPAENADCVAIVRAS